MKKLHKRANDLNGYCELKFNKNEDIIKDLSILNFIQFNIALKNKLNLKLFESLYRIASDNKLANYLAEICYKKNKLKITKINKIASRLIKLHNNK